MHIGGQLQCTLPEHTRTNWKGRLERCIIGNSMETTLADERKRERARERERERCTRERERDDIWQSEHEANETPCVWAE